MYILRGEYSPLFYMEERLILQGFELFLFLRYRFLLCIIFSIILAIEEEKND